MHFASYLSKVFKLLYELGTLNFITSFYFMVLNEEVEFKIPTTRTRNDCLFCCALLRGTARWSLLGGWVES